MNTRWFPHLVLLSGAILLAISHYSQQYFVAGVVLLTVTLWIFEWFSVPLVSLIGLVLLVAGDALSLPLALETLGDPVLQLLLGSLIIAKGISVSGLAERITYRLLSSSCATRSIGALFASLAVLSSGLSLFLSNTAVTALLLPVGLTIIERLRLRGRPEATGLLLMLTWGASVAVGVLIGSPPNLIAESALSKAGLVEIGFLNWMLFAMPLNIIMVIAAWGILSCLYIPRTKESAPDVREIVASLPKLGSISRREFVSFVIFVITVCLWIVPEALSYLSSAGSRDWLSILEVFSPSNVALIGAALFLIVPTGAGSRMRPVLTINDALRIDWRTLSLFAGGLILGKATFDSGLAATLGRWVLEVSGAESQLAITAIMVALGILLSELTSNTAAASLLVPLSLVLAQEAGVSPIPAVLGTALGTSFGFMMPISTPPNSIVYSSGQVSMKDMLRAGIIFDCVGFVVAVLGLRTILPFLGWW